MKLLISFERPLQNTLSSPVETLIIIIIIIIIIITRRLCNGLHAHCVPLGGTRAHDRGLSCSDDDDDDDDDDGNGDNDDDDDSDDGDDNTCSPRTLGWRPNTRPRSLLLCAQHHPFSNVSLWGSRNLGISWHIF